MASTSAGGMLASRPHHAASAHPPRTCSSAKNTQRVWRGVQMVEREFATLFSGDVESVHVVYDTAKLDKLVEEYEKLHGNLTDLLDDYTSKKRRHKKFKRKQVRSCFFGACCSVHRARDV